jgi:putative copper export protein
MKGFVKLNLIALISMLPLFSYAHTGHGIMEGASMIHYLLSPMHAIPVSLGILAVGIYFWRKKRATSK